MAAPACLPAAQGAPSPKEPRPSATPDRASGSKDADHATPSSEEAANEFTHDQGRIEAITRSPPIRELGDLFINRDALGYGSEGGS